MNRLTKGSTGEMAAMNFLKENGYHILERNFRCRFGEIDLIAENQEYLVFVEVKYRSSDKMGFPEESVTFQKQRKICKSALFYLMRHPSKEKAIRFDVIAILGTEITHLEHAFEFHE